jgi:hypothetical protein
VKSLTVLKNYFNTSNDPEGYVKQPLGEFVKELKELTDEEKLELATLAAADMGVELEAPA